jgi:hypothetical protein
MKHHALVGFVIFESLYAAGSSGLDHDGLQSTPGTKSIRGQRFVKSSKKSGSRKSKGKSQGKKSQCKGNSRSGSGKSRGSSNKSDSSKIGNSKSGSSKSGGSKGKGKGTTCADVVPLPAPLDEDLFVSEPRDSDPMENEIVVDHPKPVEEETDFVLDEPFEEETDVDQDEPSESNDDTFLEDICSVLERFDTSGREFGGEPSGFEWNSYCDTVPSSNSQHFLCPNLYETGKICSHENPHLDLAVEISYCEPLFRPLVDEVVKSDCIASCINYVSIDRGDCCSFSCV